MTAEVEAAPVKWLRHNGWRLERHHGRPFVRLSALRKRQRDQHAAANNPVSHQAPTCVSPDAGPRILALQLVAEERKQKGKIIQSL